MTSIATDAPRLEAALPTERRQCLPSDFLTKLCDERRST
jgi:hypothetical protein